jgi:secreted PhoX family phosphatase
MRSSDTFENVLKGRLKRRHFIKGAIATLLLPSSSKLISAPVDNLTFQPIAASTTDAIEVPAGYTARTLIRWGDSVVAGAPPFDIARQTPEAQSLQFGYNNDFVGFFPFLGGPFHYSPAYLQFSRLQNSFWGLLAVNHEYTDGAMMFPTYNRAAPTRNEVDVELAAHGVTIVEVGSGISGGWKYVPGSPFNRRITGETPIRITGPAAGHDLLKTSEDPSGTLVRGTLNNCGGGKTPWGTYLTAEENFNQYFANLSTLPDSDQRKAIHARYGLSTGATDRKWELYHNRFDISKEPNEAFRVGWVVEIDPYDPNSVVKKRTALGRTKHEAATTVIAPDGRAVVYSGDDERFDYMYKFVSTGKFSPTDRRQNMDLLDSGTLYAAKFNSDGSGEWIPLIAGQGALSAWSQPMVLINTRGAGDAVGATKMDRPEDIEVNPVNGKLYCIMTNNTQRGTGTLPATDTVNPRVNNRHGHIIELTERGNDATSLTFNWEIFMLCGTPGVAADGTYFAGFDPGMVSAISCPDNLVFDNRGNLWIATDGMPGTLQRHDGVFAVPVQGPERGFLRQFLSGPRAAEICGPEFTPNNESFFCSIQHPGEGGTIAQSTSNWPDGAGTVAKPSVVVVVKATPGSREIGT